MRKKNALFIIILALALAGGLGGGAAKYIEFRLNNLGIWPLSQHYLWIMCIILSVTTLIVTFLLVKALQRFFNAQVNRLVDIGFFFVLATTLKFLINWLLLVAGILIGGGDGVIL